MTQASKSPPTPDPVAPGPVATGPTATEQLAALAAAGSFVERRVSRGEGIHSERETSDEIMERITELLAR